MHRGRRAEHGSAPVAAREIADAERLPADYVEQILLRLRRASLVESVRGAKGGYLLSRDPKTISMRDIMTASERQTFEMNCETHPVDSERCAINASCSIRPVWLELQRRVDSLLESITLADLLKQENEVQEIIALTSSV